MEVLCKKKFLLLLDSSNKKSQLTKSLTKMTCVMLLVLLEVKVMLVSSKDSVSQDSQEKLIEV